jgi:hypothetical protein
MSVLCGVWVVPVAGEECKLWAVLFFDCNVVHRYANLWRWTSAIVTGDTAGLLSPCRLMTVLLCGAMWQ